MAELPPVPSMNPSAPDEPGKVVSAPTESELGIDIFDDLAEPEATQKETLDPSSSEHTPTAGQSADGPKRTAPGGSYSAATAANAAVHSEEPEKPRRRTTGGVSGVNESLEEVLEQTSNQMLRMSRLEDGIGTLHQTIADLREEMVAGLIETRSAAASSGGGGGGGAAPDELWQRRVAEQVDQAEVNSSKALKSQNILLGIVLVQLVLLLVIGYAVMFAPTPKESPASSPAAVESAPDSGANETPAKPASSKKQRKKRRRSR